MSQLTEDILSRIDIVDVVGRYVQLKKAGKNFLGLCPFHNEKSPSFTVAPDKQIFKCFGCGKGGNAISFLMEREKYDFMDAIKDLAEIGHVDLSQYQKHEKNQGLTDHKEKLKIMNKYMREYFQQQLFENSEAMDYLSKKRSLDLQTIKDFFIGYAPDNHTSYVSFLFGKGFTAQDIVQAGLGKISSSGECYSFFRNRIMFPIVDHRGVVVGFAGRSLDPEDMPKYLNITETVLYDKSKIIYHLNVAKEHVKEFQKIIVVEGYMDVIGLKRIGYPIGVATCGTSLTKDHISLIKRYTESVFFMFDNDKAGFEATIRGLKLCYEVNCFPRALILPEGFKDVDEIANDSDGSRIFTEMLEGSQDGFEVIFQGFLKQFNHHDPIDRKRLLDKAFDILISVRDFSILSLYIQRISHILHVSEMVLFQQLKATVSQRPQYSSSKNESPAPSEDKDMLIVSLLYQNFYHTLDIDISSLADCLLVIGGYLEGNLLNKIVTNDFTHEDKQKILEHQLYREHHIGSVHVSQRQKIVSDMIKKFLQSVIKIILKNPSLTPDQKHLCMDLVKKELIK